jgi:hypothetical protein
MKCTLIIIVSIFVIALSSCDKTTVTATCNGNPNVCMNVDSFEAQIIRRLNGNCVGYGYVINVKDQVHIFGSNGYERLSQDPPVSIFSDFHSFNPASLSKMITGITLLQQLNSKGLSITEPIWKYLPTDWTLGPNVKSITFQDLLTHRSGIRSFKYWMDYPAIRLMIDTGVTLANKATQQYDNTNFGIMRILIPRLDGQTPSGTDDELATTYGLAYEKYVNDHIFSVLGIPYLYCHPTTTPDALSYHFPDGGTNGTDWGDFTKYNGQAGWNISILQYNQVMRAAFYGTSLIPANVSKMMRDSVLAFDYFYAGKKTPYFNEPYVSKNGGFPDAGNSGAFNAQFTLFDNDVSIVLFVNSSLNYPGGVGQLIVDAFDAAHL